MIVVPTTVCVLVLILLCTLDFKKNDGDSAAHIRTARTRTQIRKEGTREIIQMYKDHGWKKGRIKKSNLVVIFLFPSFNANVFCQYKYIICLSLSNEEKGPEERFNFVN